MERISSNIKLVLALLFLVVVFIVTAYLQDTLHFNTYVALVICLIAACIFPLIMRGGE
jgi:formate hydrogenlyase subunit 4